MKYHMVVCVLVVLGAGQFVFGDDQTEGNSEGYSGRFPNLIQKYVGFVQRLFKFQKAYKDAPEPKPTMEKLQETAEKAFEEGAKCFEKALEESNAAEKLITDLKNAFKSEGLTNEVATEETPTEDGNYFLQGGLQKMFELIGKMKNIFSNADLKADFKALKTEIKAAFKSGKACFFDAYEKGLEPADFTLVKDIWENTKSQ